MIEVTWKGGVMFESVGPSGNAFTMDGTPAVGGQDHGPTPVEALLGAAAACSGIDVVTVLNKKQVPFTSYRLKVTYNRATEGDWPRPVTAMTVRHVLTGDIDPAAVERAVQLSDEKYCTVIATLRIPVAVTSEWNIVE
jgi:putative redox protein